MGLNGFSGLSQGENSDATIKKAKSVIEHRTELEWRPTVSSQNF
jgi:hypothetical protein